MNLATRNARQRRAHLGIETWLARADAADAAEDAAAGPTDPAEEIRRREERLAKMAAAREALRRETEAGRAARLRTQAEALRQKASATETPPQQQGALSTLTVRRDQQAATLEATHAAHDPGDDDQAPPTAGPDADLPHNTPPHPPRASRSPRRSGTSRIRRAGSWCAMARLEMRARLVTPEAAPRMRGVRRPWSRYSARHVLVADSISSRSAGPSRTAASGCSCVSRTTCSSYSAPSDRGSPAPQRLPEQPSLPALSQGTPAMAMPPPLAYDFEAPSAAASYVFAASVSPQSL
jgi:hypothetical protein